MLKWLAQKLKAKGLLEAALVIAGLHGVVDCFGVSFVLQKMWAQRGPIAKNFLSLLKARFAKHE